jgi:hypothetical protein
VPPDTFKQIDFKTDLEPPRTPQTFKKAFLSLSPVCSWVRMPGAGLDAAPAHHPVPLCANTYARPHVCTHMHTRVHIYDLYTHITYKCTKHRMHTQTHACTHAHAHLFSQLPAALTCEPRLRHGPGAPGVFACPSSAPAPHSKTSALAALGRRERLNAALGAGAAIQRRCRELSGRGQPGDLRAH